MPPTKLSLLLAMMARDDWENALRMASKFPQLGEHKAAITRAWAARQNPSFYRQIGQDPDALWTAGIEALRARYAPSKKSA